jgi:osmotically-inducible protein OsmY
MTMAKSDQQLKQDIEDELRWDPKINAAQVGVRVDKGVVSLLGSVDTWAAKWAVEDATKRVSGVRTVAQDLTVKLSGDHARSDVEIADAVQSALRWDVSVPATIAADVAKGHVTLHGKASGNYQREAAAAAVRNLVGVVSVFDAVALEPRTSASGIRADIESALKRQAGTDAQAIHVVTEGGRVTLSGYASSWQAAADASAAAWAAPGVSEVVDKMDIALAN